MCRKTLISFDLKNTLKRMATARRECTAKHENKALYKTDYTVPDFIEVFGQ